MIPQPHGGVMAQVEPHKKTPEKALKVEQCRAVGLNLEQIGIMIDCSGMTVKRHYEEELRKGDIRAKLNVGLSIYQSAMGEREPCEKCEGLKDVDGSICPKCKGTGEGKGWIREPNTTAQIWFSKNRMDWTDKQSVEHSGAGGGPIITEQRTSGDRIRDRLDNIQKRLGKPANEAE
jgi:hypothetical protein